MKSTQYIIILVINLIGAKAAPKIIPNLNINVDVNALLEQRWRQIGSMMDSIGSGWGAQYHNADRADLTKGVVNMFSREPLNVMILKKGNVVLNDRSGLVRKHSFDVSTRCHCFMWCQTCTFTVMAAPYGHEWSVYNNGAGGYENWAFRGHFGRRGNNVYFN